VKTVPRERFIAPRKNSVKRRPQQEGEQDAGEAFFQELPRRIPNGQQEGAGNHEKQGDGDPHQHRIKGGPGKGFIVRSERRRHKKLPHDVAGNNENTGKNTDVVQPGNAGGRKIHERVP
jgi:hypothetical protein